MTTQRRLTTHNSNFPKMGLLASYVQLLLLTQFPCSKGIHLIVIRLLVNKQTRMLSTKTKLETAFQILSIKTMTSNQDILAFLQAAQDVRAKEKDEDKETRARERK